VVVGAAAAGLACRCRSTVLLQLHCMLGVAAHHQLLAFKGGCAGRYEWTAAQDPNKI